MPTRPNPTREAAQEPGSQARVAVLLYLARRPAGSTAQQISEGTQLALPAVEYALDALCKDELKLVRREGRGTGAQYFLPVARDSLHRTLVPGLVTVAVPAPATAGARA